MNPLDTSADKAHRPEPTDEPTQPEAATTSTDAQHQSDRANWTIEDARELYGIKHWGMGYFDIAESGEATYLAPRLNREATGDTSTPAHAAVPFSRIIDGLRQRGLDMPVMLRLENVVDDRVSELNQNFADAIQTCDYQNVYRGVFPIKVNQQSHVIDEIARFGESFHHGLEAGSKAELLIAMSHVRSPESVIICNGYKDEEFVDLGFQALRMGMNCFFVIETPKELPILLARAKHWGIEPQIGVRVKLSTTVDGHWSGDSGDRSLFGLSTLQLIRVVDQLRDQGMLNCLKLLHFHLGSQLPNIRNIRDGITEACRFYLDLIREGAPMGYLDIGGGLAVDYDGTGSTEPHSRNYNLNEYCVDIVEAIMDSLDPHDVPHPVIVSESGRWTVAPMSVLIFNILEVNQFTPQPLPDPLPEISTSRSNVCWIHSSISIRVDCKKTITMPFIIGTQARRAFRNGLLNLRERALAENICLMILHQVAERVPQMRRPPVALLNLADQLSDIYYGNFSVFQSLPDSWAINQVFPVIPLGRLNEEPTQNGIIGDLTCDCDGKLNRFVGYDSDAETLRLHAVEDDEDYCIGVFLVGAYQETLGDLHNLFGDTNIASVRVLEGGELRFVHEIEGDSISDVLSYVEYQPSELFKRLREHAENAVEAGKITLAQRQEMLNLFSESLRGYTYFES